MKGTKLSALAFGDTICDMHYGIQQLLPHYKVGHHLRFYFDSGNRNAQMRAFQSFIELAGEGNREQRVFYTNKELVLIAAPRADDWYTAAYSYDGTFAGIIQLADR